MHSRELALLATEARAISIQSAGLGSTNANLIRGRQKADASSVLKLSGWPAANFLVPLISLRIQLSQCPPFSTSSSASVNVAKVEVARLAIGEV